LVLQQLGLKVKIRLELTGAASVGGPHLYIAFWRRHWLKVKNRKHPAMSRVMEAFA